MENAILILIGIVATGFIWLLWLRQNLLHQFRDVSNHMELLRWDLWRRRDMVPYLLESFRSDDMQNETWQRLLGGRKHFHGLTTLADEWEYGSGLLKFLEDADIKNLNFLEAKKDIETVTEIIKKEKEELELVRTRFNELRIRFPYSLASGIFGFQNLEQ